MAAYVAAVERARPAVNVAALVGHSTLRVATMDDPYRAATRAEQARMVELLREGMDAGAIGLSLRRVLRDRRRRRRRRARAARRRRRRSRRRLHDAHPRRDERQVLDSLDEAFATAPARPACRWSISHHKCAGPRNWGRTVQTLAAHRRRARAAADRARRLSLRRRLDRAARGSGRRHHRRHRHVVDAASGDGGAARWPTSPPNGTARSRRPASGCSRAAPATSRCARTTCSACCAIRPR